MKRETQDTIVGRMGEQCLMMRTRLLSRVITAIYDEELSGSDIKGSQLNLLVAIAQAGPLRRSELARVMQIDISTLTRNLRVMEQNGWIEESNRGADGRGAPIRVTTAGRALIARIAPAWERAQTRARALLEPEAAAGLTSVSNRLMSLA